MSDTIAMFPPPEILVSCMVSPDALEGLAWLTCIISEGTDGVPTTQPDALVVNIEALVGAELFRLAGFGASLVDSGA